VFRPDLVDVWVFRTHGPGRPGDRGGSGSAGGSEANAGASDRSLELLLMRRSPGRILAGLWQGVSGSLEPRERVVAGALRELHEETGYSVDEIEALYDLDQVNQFHEPSVDAILTAAIFAVRVRNDLEPTLSHEHDAHRWVTGAEALDVVVWPAYRESIARIERDLLDPAREPWFRLGLDGTRPAG
jgi:8-oxo-dGTP pyrophosphatase MutT (NUDIX family)